MHQNTNLTLTMTLYLSYPITTMERMEATPHTAPANPYNLHPKAPQTQYLCMKTLMVTVGPMVVIMIKSEMAKLTTNMLVWLTFAIKVDIQI